MTDTDPTRHASRTARGAAELELGEAAMDLLRSRLADIAENTVTAIIALVRGKVTSFVRRTPRCISPPNPNSSTIGTRSFALFDTSDGPQRGSI